MFKQIQNKIAEWERNFFYRKLANVVGIKTKLTYGISYFVIEERHADNKENRVIYDWMNNLGGGGCLPNGIIILNKDDLDMIFDACQKRGANISRKDLELYILGHEYGHYVRDMDSGKSLFLDHILVGLHKLVGKKYGPYENKTQHEISSMESYADVNGIRLSKISKRTYGIVIDVLKDILYASEGVGVNEITDTERASYKRNQIDKYIAERYNLTCERYFDK